jgi:salicylate hydroxylase
VPPGIIHLKKALKHTTDLGDSLQLSFEDGSAVEADIVVGADGIRSVSPRHYRCGCPLLMQSIVCQR